MTLINNSYPVFEADQVLSQKHLNKLISYLEEQDRASRVQLLGMGIVCGLDISKPTASSVHIDCGVGTTSLGFLIPFDAKGYTHVREIELSDAFLTPDIAEHAYLGNLYEYTNLYEAFKNSQELVDATHEDPTKEVLTETILDNKIVMLLVEALLIDNKNCVALDCDDKGKRLEFKIRPLLIDADTITDTEFKLNDCDRMFFDPLVLPRYNVPKNDLTKVSDILGGYKNLIVKSVPLVNNAFNNMHDYYADAFSELDDYIRLHNVSGRINSVFNQNKSGFYLQYVWDWIADLAETYNEIAQFHACNPSVCCPDKSIFPFHILLGSAEFATEEILHDNDLYKFRTAFIKTGVLGDEERILKQELKGLIEKLIRQIGTFDLNLEAVINQGIKITPSCSGKTPLSKKAIPYYYSDIPELNKKWSPELTMKNQNTNILSYHAEQYNTTNDHVTDPLEYDIQHHDFFRIEGHIGEDHTQAMIEVTALQEQYRLPFKVVGVNAVDDQGRIVIFNNDGETWDDLEIEYDLAKTKLINTAEFIVNWLKNNKTVVQEVYPFFNDSFLTSLENTVNEFNTLLTDDLTEFLENYQTFYDALEQLNDIFLLHNFCIDFVQSGNDSAVLQEIENRLDEFNTIILEDAFTVIYQEAIERWIRGVKSTFLSQFSKKHPALEHHAGVAKGGTFVMVYSDYSIFQKTGSPLFERPLFFGFARDHIAKFDYSPVSVEKITNNNVLRKRKVHNAYLNDYTVNDDDPCSSGIGQAVSDYQNNISNYVSNNFNPIIASYIDANLRPSFSARPSQPNNDTAVQKKIIADFYLPYICCSDGDNINIVLGTAEPIVADFDGADFDGSDFFTNDQ